MLSTIKSCLQGEGVPDARPSASVSDEIFSKRGGEEVRAVLASLSMLVCHFYNNQRYSGASPHPVALHAPPSNPRWTTAIWCRRASRGPLMGTDYDERREPLRQPMEECLAQVQGTFGGPNVGGCMQCWGGSQARAMPPPPPFQLKSGKKKNIKKKIRNVLISATIEQPQ